MTTKSQRPIHGRTPDGAGKVIKLPTAQTTKPATKRTRKSKARGRGSPSHSTGVHLMLDKLAKGEAKRMKGEGLDAYLGRLDKLAVAHEKLQAKEQVNSVMYRLLLGGELLDHLPKTHKRKWQDEQAKKLGYQDGRTIRHWISAHNAVEEARSWEEPLPTAVLDRSIERVPKAVEMFREHGDPDYQPEPVKLTPKMKAKAWPKIIGRYIQVALGLPDPAQALRDLIAAAQQALAQLEGEDDGKKPNVESVGSPTCTSTASTVRLEEKYRPRRFDQVIGNEDAVKDLVGYCRVRLSRAFLLCGPTGTGKTTLARLAAMSFHCEGERGNGYEPCGVCAPCKSFEAAPKDLMSVVMGDYITEMSAARSSDGAKAVEAVLDELSSMNAPLVVNEADRLMVQQHRLFQALEGDLRYPVFFSTIHPEKMDPQFVGRCVRIETARLDSAVLRQRLTQVAAAEGHPLPNGKIEAVLEHLGKVDAAGQMRDALVRLEQVLLATAGSCEPGEDGEEA